MRRSSWIALAVVIVSWIVAVCLIEACLLWYLFEEGGDKACYSCAFNKAESMQRPGSWNGNQPWTAAQANAYKAEYARLFWQEARAYSIPFLIVAMSVLSLVVLLCIRNERYLSWLRDRQFPYFLDI